MLHYSHYSNPKSGNSGRNHHHHVNIGSLIVFIFVIVTVIVFEVLFIASIRDSGGGGSSGGFRDLRAFRQRSLSNLVDYYDVGDDGGVDGDKDDYDDDDENESVRQQDIPDYNDDIGSSWANANWTIWSMIRNDAMLKSRWQRVHGTKYRFNVYSAFYDNRNIDDPIVRIVATTKTERPDYNLDCILNYYRNESQTTNTFRTAAKLKLIRENWKLPFSAYFVICPLRSLAFVTATDRSQNLPRPHETPESVSVRARYASRRITNRLPIVDNRYVQKRDLAVCIKPIHYEFNNVSRILEFLELNRLLGIEHFTFYEHSIGPNVRCVLREYERENRCDLLPWNMQLKSQKDIRTENQFAAFNDCLYRSMYRFRYVAFIDLDEFLVPKTNRTLIDLIEYLNKQISKSKSKSTTIGSFSFQNAFFYLQWPDDDNANGVSHDPTIDLLTQRKTRRKEKLNPHKQRSKYVCRPDLVTEAGNHFVWEFVKRPLPPPFPPVRVPIKVFEVPANLALSHHYRICEFGGDACIDKTTASLVDRTTWTFGERLRDAVRDQWQRLRNKCNLTLS